MTFNAQSVSPGPSSENTAKQCAIERVKSSTPTKPPPSRKRKAALDDDEDDDLASRLAQQDSIAGIDTTKLKKPRKTKSEQPAVPEEKRLRRVRGKAPQFYLERLSRVKAQRMFLIDRNRSKSEDDTHEEEVFDIAGTTGNIYQVKICKIPSCTCPDAAKGNQCKHIIYVMVNILKAREDLAYQLALLSTEITEIFAFAPVTPQSNDPATSLTTDTGGSRKPIEGDCPVCVMEFEEADKSEDILWCKAACGQNIHRHCFEQWAKSKAGKVKCVYCRSLWKGDEESMKRISKAGKMGSEGYVNVGGDLGLSGQRDMSSYHPFWVQRQQSYGGGNGYY